MPISSSIKVNAFLPEFPVRPRFSLKELDLITQDRVCVECVSNQQAGFASHGPSGG